MKVVIVGKGLMLANLILGAIDAGAEIVGVFRYEQTCSNRLKLFFQEAFNPPPELTLIKQLKLNQIRLKSVNSQKFRKILISQNVDLLFVGTWKERISKETFNIPKIATVNAHPSLLPAYRGPNPYLQTILHGEEFSGVTLHLVNEKYDGGAILSQEKVPILNSDTSKELREKSVAVARKLTKELITDLNEKIITPIEQNEKNASYYPNISGEEKMLDFTVQTSDEISRTIRALHPFLPCYITYKDKFFVVNPYHFSILLEKFENQIAGDIVAKNPDKNSLTIVCKDKKSIRFSGLELYKEKIKTKNFIKNDVILQKR
jgi:methionyl-tRNA formyltransferase